MPVDVEADLQLALHDMPACALNRFHLTLLSQTSGQNPSALPSLARKFKDTKQRRMTAIRLTSPTSYLSSTSNQTSGAIYLTCPTDTRERTN